MANRGLARLAGDGIDPVRTSVRTSQLEVEAAGRLIDVLSELSRRAEAPAERLELGELVAQAVERARAALAARGLALARPGKRPAAWITGSAVEAEAALDDLFAVVSGAASPGECRASFESSGAVAKLVVRVPIRTPAPDLNSLFGLREPSGGSPAGGALALARWTFESLGGALDASVEGPSLVVSAAVPAEAR